MNSKNLDRNLGFKIQKTNKNQYNKIILTFHIRSIILIFLNLIKKLSILKIIYNLLYIAKE